MALNASQLASAIKSATDALNVDETPVTNDALLQAMAQAIVDHITTNGQVIVSGGSSAGTYSIT